MFQYTHTQQIIKSREKGGHGGKVKLRHLDQNKTLTHFISKDK